MTFSKAKLVSLSVRLVVILGLAGVGWYLYELDNAAREQAPNQRDLLPAIQHGVNVHFKDTYSSIRLEGTGTDNEYTGTATAKDGTVFNLTGKYQDGQVSFKGLGREKEAYASFTMMQLPQEQHPRTWLFVYAVAGCLSVFGIAYPLLGIFGWRGLQSAAWEKLLRFCALGHCFLLTLMVYSIVNVLKHWPLPHPVFVE